MELPMFKTEGKRFLDKWVVSKNRGTPKWMVKIMENPIKMDDLGVPLFLETPKAVLGFVLEHLEPVKHHLEHFLLKCLFQSSKSIDSRSGGWENHKGPWVQRSMETMRFMKLPWAMSHKVQNGRNWKPIL